MTDWLPLLLDLALSGFLVGVLAGVANRFVSSRL